MTTRGVVLNYFLELFLMGVPALGKANLGRTEWLKAETAKVSINPPGI